MLSAAALALALAACSPESERAPPPPSTPQAPLNHREIAMANLAHKDIGEDATFIEESISFANGRMKLCGSFAKNDRPDLIQRYVYYADYKKIVHINSESEWDQLCSNGWKVGTGQ